MKVSSVTAPLLLVIILITASCGGGASSHIDSHPPGFQLNVLPETATHGTAACTWDTAVEPTASGCLVTISATGAVDQKALYFDLEYDAATVHPVSAEPVDTSLECEPLSVSILDDRGTVHYGMILPNPDARDGFSGDGALAKVEFEYGTAELSRRTCSVPTAEESRTLLMDDYQADLAWYFSHAGDCNQDGLVNATDLTPIGVHFGEYNDYFADPAGWSYSSANRIVDTNTDYHITVADITAIGRNYGSSITGGYNIYSGEDIDDYPEDNNGSNGPGAALLGNVSVSDTSTADPSENRKYFTYTVESPDSSLIYWLRPLDQDGNEGIPSNFISQIGLRVPRSDESAQEIVWDSESSELHWNYRMDGDYDQNALVGATDMALIGMYWDTASPFDADSVCNSVDGNLDGVINFLDTDSIAINYDDLYGGYSVFTSANPADYPRYNDELPVIDPVQVFIPESQYDPLSPFTGQFVKLREMSCEIDDPVSGNYYWIRLRDWNGNYGTPSNMVQIPAT